MKTFVISISKKAVLHQANLRAFYVGESLKNDGKTPSQYASRMQSDTDNDDVMEGFATAALGRLVDIMNQVSVDVSKEVTLDNIQLTVSVSDLFAESQTTFIQEGCFEYMVNWTLHEWFNLTDPNNANKFLEKCALIENNIKDRINKRLKPEER